MSVASGRVIDVSRRQGLSAARVEDARGTLLAHATSRCVLQRCRSRHRSHRRRWRRSPLCNTARPIRTCVRARARSSRRRSGTRRQASTSSSSGRSGSAPPRRAALARPAVRRRGRWERDARDARIALVLHRPRHVLGRRPHGPRGLGDQHGGDHVAARTSLLHTRPEGELPSPRDPGQARSRRARQRRATRSDDRRLDRSYRRCGR